MVRIIPLWVKLPQFPLHLWVARNLRKIGSAIGTPLIIYECTINKLIVSYARILVEVNITQEPKKEIDIKDLEVKGMKQPIEYEWRSLYCVRC